jgi:hypothetical protein
VVEDSEGELTLLHAAEGREPWLGAVVVCRAEESGVNKSTTSNQVVSNTTTVLIKANITTGEFNILNQTTKTATA